MPKATSKKKKYNARFPPARIKKIMQMDEEVGKVAAAVPVIISRALEMFIESLVTETSKVTRAKNAKTLSTSHIKHTITGTKQFDFLRDLVQNVPDHQAEDNGESSFEREPSVVKMGRGRPRNVDEYKQRDKSRRSKASSDEEDKDDDDDSEETETDDESTSAQTSYQGDFKPNISQIAQTSCQGDFKPNMSHSAQTSCQGDFKPNVSYQSDFKPGLPHPNIRPSIEQLLQAASSLQQQQQQQQQQQNQHYHNPLQPPVSDNTMSHNNNNNNNYVPSSAAGTASLIRDSLVSGKNVVPDLNHQSLPLSSNCVPPSPLSQIKQPFYQMPSNYDSPLPSQFSSQLPSKVSFYNSNSNPLNIPSYIQSPISQKLSQQQQQPIDLSHPLRQSLKDEDDYDT